MRYISRDADENRQLVEALTSHGVTHLKRLDLSSNTDMWKDEQNIDTILNYISQQTNLEGLELGWQNYLPSETSFRILKIILNSPCLHTIKKLDLTDCHWDDTENCNYLAEFIAKASSLEEVLLTTHESDREIEVKRTPAGAGSAGSVQIVDADDESVICEVASETAQEIKIE